MFVNMICFKNTYFNSNEYLKYSRIVTAYDNNKPLTFMVADEIKKAIVELKDNTTNALINTQTISSAISDPDCSGITVIQLCGDLLVPILLSFHRFCYWIGNDCQEHVDYCSNYCEKADCENRSCTFYDDLIGCEHLESKWEDYDPFTIFSWLEDEYRKAKNREHSRRRKERKKWKEASQC